MQRPHDHDPRQHGVATALGDQHQRLYRGLRCRRVVLALGPRLRGLSWRVVVEFDPVREALAAERPADGLGGAGDETRAHRIERDLAQQGGREVLLGNDDGAEGDLPGGGSVRPQLAPTQLP
jgi:hypothetical protein